MLKSTYYLFGILATSLVLGCGGGEKDKAQPIKKDAKVEKEKEPEAPNGGHILHGMAGEKHVAEHLEFVFDEKTKESTLYVVIEKDGKFEPHALDVETIEFHYQPEDADDEVELEFAVVADAEPKGSKFVLAADKLPEGIEDEDDFEGHVHLELDGVEVVYDMHHDGDGHVH